MVNIINKYSCSGCKAYYNMCPKNCIDMLIDKEGFWYPKVNEDECIQCRLCEKICPEVNIYNNKKAYSKPITLAAWNNDKFKREASSSGGIFTSIAEWILFNNGVVFGAGYDDEYNVIHKEASSLEELTDLRGSKYVQSDINDTYTKAKRYLEEDKKVLFAGTPCQIAGLYNFLQKTYDNLCTCDIVCHGVPSPKVFNKYKQMLERLNGSTIERIAFRDKKYGWKLYSLSLLFNNDKEYSKTLREDPYMLGFLRNYYLRPSCYTCTYAKLPRISDITLGDFWGVGNKYPELDDDKGTSLILVNTDKGKTMVDNCKDDIFNRQCNLEHAIKGNPCIIKPSREPEMRRRFFEDFNNNDFDYVVKKYMSPPSWFEKQIMFARRVLGYIKRRTSSLFNCE